MTYETFAQFGLSENILKAVEAMGFTSPSEIQGKAIPLALQGKDVIGLAQTGTGKTAAFGIPIVEAASSGRPTMPVALVLVPTRELAVQAALEIGKIGKEKGIVSVAVYGGQSIVPQIQAIRKGVHVVVGTPGRIMDHLERKTLAFDGVRTVVLDEADEMLNMGFIEDMEAILTRVPSERQTMLFSATMPQPILRLTGRFMTHPITVRAEAREAAPAKIRQVFYEVRQADREKALMRVLDVEEMGRTLIFCQTKKEVDDLSSALQAGGYGVGAIHGDYAQELRDEAMKRFRQGTTKILVATDVAARGIDIPDVTHVINFGPPNNLETYVHRIGRTGRIGKDGTAITLATPFESRRLRMIERSTNVPIKKLPIPTKDQVRNARGKKVLDSLEAVIGQGVNPHHRTMVEMLCRLHSPEEVAAAAIRLVAGDMEVADIAEMAVPARPVAKRPFATDVSPSTRPGATPVELVTVRLEGGRMDGVSVPDLLNALSTKGGVHRRNIGRILLHSRHSTVEVPAHLAGQVAASLNRGRAGGKIGIRKETGGSPRAN